MPYTPDFDRLRMPGFRFADEFGEHEIEVHPAGMVVLPTGRVVGFDPLICPEAEPYTVGVEPGRYPARAWVSLVREPGGSERRVAALELVVRDEPVARWETAQVEGRSPAGDDDGGYCVDSATAALADPVALAALRGWDEDDVLGAFLAEDDGAGRRPIMGLADVVTDEATGANVLTVTTGWGDGCYQTWIGRTADDRVASFLTDFGVLPGKE
ncbi:DUF4241 domain-containing protein [Micromonospora sp. NPDC005806]|uniref:DUF4241 domain-containing protein n=1 Tax=Micromonospora sp. NPDC005806 TaxID=3364234 RepID=UPI0036746685